MKLAALFLLSIIAAANALGQAEPAQDAVATRPLQMDLANCPLDLQAEHDGSLTQSKAAYGMHGDVLPPIPEQRLLLTFTNLRPNNIVNARITAHGFSEKGRLVPLSGVPAAPDLNRTITVTLLLKQRNAASKELSLSRFAVVSTLELDAVTYADGSTWHASSAEDCRVTPDPIMRVTALR